MDRTFDVDGLPPDDAAVEPTDLPSFATWNESTGEYSESEVLKLLRETRDCLRARDFFTDAAALCRLCARFCTHIRTEELYGTLDRLV